MAIGRCASVRWLPLLGAACAGPAFAQAAPAVKVPAGDSVTVLARPVIRKDIPLSYAISPGAAAEWEQYAAPAVAARPADPVAATPPVAPAAPVAAAQPVDPVPAGLSPAVAAQVAAELRYRSDTPVRSVAAYPGVAVDAPASAAQAYALPVPQAAPAPVYGPQLASYGPPPPQANRYRSVGAQLGAVKWEVGLAVGYMTAINLVKLRDVGSRSFGFQDEGWFGKDTINLGVDKLTHAFNSYLLADIFANRIRHKTGGTSADSAFTGALIGSGLMIYSELYDGIKNSSGFSYQDVIANTAGAAFSVVRNSVPGMKEKVDFRILVKPNGDFYTFTGTKHYEQQRFLMALTLSGFDGLKDTPLRFVELHAGYRASGFTREDRLAGERLRRRPFVGIGLNVKELLFARSTSRIGKAAGSVLDYVQIPYTAKHFD